MKFVISRDLLLQPLILVAGVVERRQTLPILANVLLRLKNGQLSLTGTDLEVELVGRIDLEISGDDGEITVPARKLVEICKSLPERGLIEFALKGQRVVVKCGRSRFTLATLPASDFPSIEDDLQGQSFDIKQGDLKRLLAHTMFAMALQDVRYFLNGMLWEIGEDYFRVVATDGHRLAMATLEMAIDIEERQVILPRKGVLEFARLLQEGDEEVDILLGDAHLRAVAGDFTFTSKLLDGKYPDYQRVLPRNINKQVQADREDLKSALSRAAILSNEKYRGVRLHFTQDELRIEANNPEQEEAKEIVSINYPYDSPLEIGFNVSYLLDVLGAIPGETVKMSLSDSNSSALIEDNADSEALYVVMPMKL